MLSSCYAYITEKELKKERITYLKKEKLMTQKRVWLFREGNADMRNLLGGKGANLAEMTNLGLPVPPGLTITTETCY